jgi:Signal recognition particle receptor beta subunit.
MIHDAPQDQVLKDIMIHSHSTTGGDDGSSSTTSYKDTVILFGPSGSGKSLLFYKIANIVQHSLKEDDNDSSSLTAAVLQENIDTVMSLRANVQIVQSSSPSIGQTKETKNDRRNVRLIDYPGHKTLLFPKLLDLLLPHGNDNAGGSSCSSCGATNTSSRALLVVDSTKSVGEAAWILYKILTWDKFVQEWKTRGEKDGLHIMVVCNKSDESIAKNWRRIKIQLRNELEALRKVSTKVGSVIGEGTEKERGEETEFVLSGKSIDLDDLSKNGVKGVKLSFMSYSAKTGDGLRDLCDFVMNGSLPKVDSSRILDRKK